MIKYDMEERLNIRTVRNLVQNGEYLYQRLPDGLVNDATTQALVSNDYAILNDLRGKELWKWVLSQPGIQIASYKCAMGILRYIINSGDWEWFEWFSWHPNINTLLQDHTVAYYLLQRAVIENNTGSIKYVVMVCDVDINALHAAAIQSFSEEAKTLSLDTDKRSLLELALISHSYDAMDILLHFGATPVVALPTGGITSILHSYYICQPYMELLIHKYGFPIDARCPSGSGQTPLCCALSQRWSVVERTSMLLDFGAQINGIPMEDWRYRRELISLLKWSVFMFVLILSIPAVYFHRWYIGGGGVTFKNGCFIAVAYTTFYVIVSMVLGGWKDLLHPCSPYQVALKHNNQDAAKLLLDRGASAAR